MTTHPASPELQAAAPELGRRLTEVLLPLAKAVAAGFLRRPKLVALIIPLYVRLIQVARRVVAAVLRTRGRRASRSGQVREASTRKVRPRLPGGRGWLKYALAHDGAAYASQLEHLLGQPEMRAAIEAAPGVGRVLRPICWMLGISPRVVTSTAELVAQGDVRVDGEGGVVWRKPERVWPAPAKPAKVKPEAERWPWEVAQNSG